MRKVIDRTLPVSPYTRPLDFNNQYTPVENTAGKAEWRTKYSPYSDGSRVNTKRDNQNSKSSTI